jgi:hypothetical protein
MTPLSPDPTLLDCLLDLIGQEATIALCVRYGGQRMSIPEILPPGHWLAEAVGPQAAEILCRHYGRCTIEVPKALRLLAAQRDCLIWERALAGASKSALVREFGLTRRRIQQILATQRQNPPDSCSTQNTCTCDRTKSS